MRRSDLLWAAGAASAAAFAWGAVHPASQLFGPTIRRIGDDAIGLTFDDGPNPSVTPRLLDLLDHHRVSATFFVLGRCARAYPGLVREIRVRGHSVGNHTNTHPRLVWHPAVAIERELRNAQHAIADAAGAEPRLFRPPFGYRRPGLQAIAARAGLTRVVMWSVIARDWNGCSATIDRRLARVRPGDIVVLHDGDFRRDRADRDATLRALEKWLPRWRARGWRMAALE